jgi:glycosyltransferase involved in cell wall biosynthesis
VLQAILIKVFETRALYLSNLLKMIQQKIFSVIIPTYHRNDLLAKCLDCLAPGVQTLPAEQYEVIVTDDGYESTAQEMIQQNYPWAKWVAGFRKGPAANRNNGARYARGEWLAFTDDDCLPDPNWLLSFATAIVLDVQVYEGKTTCEAGIKSPLEHAPINLTGGCLWSCNMMIQTKLFQDLEGFNENFPHPHMEDIEFRKRIEQSANVFKFIEFAIVDHPPRRLPWGDKLATTQESIFMYWRKVEKQKNITLKLILIIIRTRLVAIFGYPISIDTFKALLSLIMELIYVAINIKVWNNKYPLP